MGVEEERPAGRCPRCGAPHDAYQEYCLECGLRLPSAFVTTRQVWWSRESPLWLVAALVAFLLIALAGAAAAMVLADDGGQREARTPTGGAAPATTAPTFPTGTSEFTTIEPTTPTTYTLPTLTGTTNTTNTSTTGPSAGSLTTWPAGTNGYTIVLASVPVAQGRSRAEAAARRAQNANLTQVGVLESSNFGSLRPGYYVAFSGIYTTIGQAESALGTARNAGFPLAYVREIRGASGSGGSGSGGSGSGVSPGPGAGGSPGAGGTPGPGGSPGPDGGSPLSR